MRLAQFVRATGWPDRLILATFVLAFSVATINHVTDLVIGGLFPYTAESGAPWVLNVYWTSLTLLDPLAIALLFVHIRAGYVAALAIMLTDVPINIYAQMNGFPGVLPGRDYSGMEGTGIPLQAAFLVFLLITARRVWMLSESRHKSSTDVATE